MINYLRVINGKFMNKYRITLKILIKTKYKETNNTMK